MKDKKQQKKKIYVSILALAMMGSLILNVLPVSAYGPKRTTYTMDEPAEKAVFNSITDNSAVGDERDFVRVVEVRTDGENNDYTNEVHVMGGKTYEVWIYFHNNASNTYNYSAYNYRGIAYDTRVNAIFPDSIKSGEKGEVKALIYSRTADPTEVWDEAYFIADENVTLSYITDTARIYNDHKASGSILPSSELFGEEGTLIGENELNGVIPGCDEWSGFIVYRVKAEKVIEPSSTFDMDKKVSLDGGATWLDEAELTPGKEVEFKISYKNTGTLTQKVTMFDTLENGKEMEYVVGSTRIVANGTEKIVQDEDGGKLFNGGVEIGEIKPGETAEVYYKVKLKEASEFSCQGTILYNLAGASAQAINADGTTTANGTATQHDKVRISVKRNDDGCLPSELPKTGPAEIALAIIVAAGLVVGVFYYINSKRTLKRLQAEASGDGGLEKPEQM